MDMFEELEESKEVIERYLEKIDNYILFLQDKKSAYTYIEVVDKIKKEFVLFLSNIKNISDNFMQEISIRYYETDERMRIDHISNGIDEFDLDEIKKFNYELKDKLRMIRLHSIIDPFYEDDIQFYKELTDYSDQINKLRLSFLKFYRDTKNKYKPQNLVLKRLEKDFYNFTSDKMNEIDMRFNSFENNVKSVASKYNIAGEDLKNLNKSYLDVSEKVKGVYSQLTEINSNIFNLNEELNKKISEFDAELKVRADRVEKKIHDNTISVLKDFTKELDETEALITQEVNSVKKTSRSFKDFISDETAIKLTDDYKSKANFEMYSYYFFNILSFGIIGFAIYFSYSSLSDFATKHTGDYKALDLAYLGIRLIFSILIFSTIAFTSRLASKSYIYWKKNEGVFLRLTALKSFIADMSEAKKEEIHEKLVDVYFGKDEQEQNLNQKMNDLPNNITQLLGKVVEQTTVVLDASKPKKDAEPPANGGG
ncbi:hypothetical protein [Acinetobacter sp. IK40]|jgi:hypothetical protein|uniref:hypothetical protein n=1 Tax=Acinetobacter sp. IK40 TaxID=2928897 RepID=UPI002D1F4E6A|nr:hypothetical protein [Acinetobacter sp. IK40]MEB3791508.1 hypothetical protein [Acinetobacter sp. IK40]